MYTTRTELTSDLVLPAALTDMLIGEMAEAQSLLQVVSKNRTLQTAFRDISKSPSTLKTFIYDIGQIVKELSVSMLFTSSSLFIDGL